jgi:hypothetical protein
MLNFLKIMNSLIKNIINKSFASNLNDAFFVLDKVGVTVAKLSLNYLWGFGFGYLTSWALTILSDLNYLSLLILTMEVGKFLLMILVYYLYNKYIKSTLSNYYYKCSYRVFQTLNMLRSKVPYFNYYFFFNYYIFSCIVFCLYTYFAMKYVLDMVFCDNNDMLNTENPTVNENFQADKTNNNELDFKNKWSKWGAITITVIGCIISGYWLYKKITHLEIETPTAAASTTNVENTVENEANVASPVTAAASVYSPISESNLKNVPTVPSPLISPLTSPLISPLTSPAYSPISLPAADVYPSIVFTEDASETESNNSVIKEPSNDVISPVTSPVSSPAIAVESPSDFRALQQMIDTIEAQSNNSGIKAPKEEAFDENLYNILLDVDDELQELLDGLGIEIQSKNSVIKDPEEGAVDVNSSSYLKDGDLQQMIDAIDAQSNNSLITEPSIQLFSPNSLKDESLQKLINSSNIVLKYDAPIIVAPNTERIPLEEELDSYRFRRLKSIIYGEGFSDALFSNDKTFVKQKTMLQEGCSLGVFPKEDLDHALISVRYDAFHRKYTFKSPPAPEL